jgi:predicted RNase H-like HicB family nuclease
MHAVGLAGPGRENGHAGITMKFKVAIHLDDDGFAVSGPGLPGCWSQGEPEQEALANIEVAIRECLEVVDEFVEGSTVREIEIAV